MNSFLLKTNSLILAHYTTIHHEPDCANVYTKKLKTIAAVKNENLWSDFIQCMAQYKPEQLGFFDKVLKDKRTSSWQCERSSKAYTL